MSKKNISSIVLGLLVFLIVGGVYVATKPGERVQPVAPATGLLIETRPLLSDAVFTGRVAEAYRIAAEIPKVIDSLFCYCYCKKNHQHKTLLTCYTNRHGSKCDICMGEVFYAYELYNQGKTLDEIVIAVDKKFYRPYRRT
ncbi:MAG: hypothetical protein HOL15_01870 [Nitrospinaceae bacterium]|nr:hypothetical protein [Nitrospina sp.]MBT5375540.1 hypothetical protein [Nitrospinaceae bacterium]MBT5868526.1 hypothetical protein [Nitrospinaceae bacterium]MBT6345291.1 hypothetical protein [Nitrospina sp.]